jgi:hypothetical protein
MNWNALLGIACIISFTLPIAVIIYNRYYTHRSLAALLIYFALTLLDNLLAEGIIPSTAAFSGFVSIFDNYADVPLIMTALLFFCPNKQKQSKVRLLTILFLAYEIVITCIYGFNKTAVIYIMGAGTCLVLVYTSYLFVRQVRFSIFHGKNHGRMIMLASVLFGYACYLLIYYFNYIQNTPYKADVLKLYFISSVVSAVLMAIGLHLMRKRIQELKSVKITRKELAVFFGHRMQQN